VALLALVGDARLLVRGGISGTQRIARHLWRMCFALFIAASSIFLARQHLFPVFMRKMGMLFFLSFLPLILMVYWMVRVRFTNRGRRLGSVPLPQAGENISRLEVNGRGLAANRLTTVRLRHNREPI